MKQLPILIAGVLGMAARRREWRADIMLYGIVATFAAVYSIYWPATRLRAPMDIILMVFAAAWLDRWRRTRTPEAAGILVEEAAHA